MASNGDWGYLESDEQRDAWDRFSPLPDRGANPHLDSFCERKGLSIPDLVRVGARLSAPTVLAFAYPGGLKYRDLDTGERWNWLGSNFPALKVLPPVSSNGGPPTVLVAEGETDGAWLSTHYPSCSIALLPVGALGWKPRYTEQLTAFEHVYLALDADTAGDEGARRIGEMVPGSARFRPPANDWCEVKGEPPPLPQPPTPKVILPILVGAGQLLALEPPRIAAYHKSPILPLGGTAILHGAYKSGKSWVALDLLASLAQGIKWAAFEPDEGPVKVGVIQFEVPWAFYRQRVQLVRNHAPEQSLFDANFFTYSPLRRPKLRAGREDSEAPIVRDLVAAGVKVALIDPIRRGLRGADMNAEADVSRMMGFAERLNDEGIAVVLVHHDNKSGSRHRGGDPDDMTGSGQFAGDPDAILSIERPDGVEKSEVKRNLHFLLRNGVSPPSLAYELTDQAKLIWHDEPIIIGDDTEPDV